MRHARTLALLALLLVAPLPGIQAEPIQILTDDAGDVEADTLDGASAPPGSFDPSGADLLSLTIDESDKSLQFVLAVGSVAPEIQGSGNARFQVEFWNADQAYRIIIERDSRVEGSHAYNAELEGFDAGRDRFVGLMSTELEVDPSANTYTVRVPREALVDGNGTAPTAGRELRLLRVQSQEFVNAGLFVSIGLIQMSDAMPDSGTSLPYAVQRGLVQSGHAFLASSDPVRASNGEEATFLYYVDASNLASEDDRFDLTTSNVPQGWSITLPASTIRIGGNQTVRFPVLVTTPFNHQHGAFENFILSMTSQHEKSAVGRLEMGIRYLAVPQPAGHHDTVWIHTRPADRASDLTFCLGCPPTTIAYMNTLENDDRDEGMPASGSNSFLGTGHWAWNIFLEPGLQMGLDFNTNDTGAIEVGFTAPLSVNNAVLSGRLTHYAAIEDPDGRTRLERTILAEILETTPRDLQGDVLLDTILIPTAASDFVRYNSRAALALELDLDGDMPTVGGTEEQTQPHLTGGTMQLPLLEYRDPVDDVFSELAGLTLRHADRAEKFVNPGETVLFNLTLQNEGAIDDVFEIRVNGTNQAWARVLGDQRIFVGTGNERHVVVAISPPMDAPDGAVVDLVVTVASLAEPTVQGNIRVVATVDDLVDRTDEGFLVQDAESRLHENKKSPGTGTIVMIALLGAIACTRRRQREPSSG